MVDTCTSSFSFFRVFFLDFRSIVSFFFSLSPQFRSRQKFINTLSRAAREREREREREKRYIFFDFFSSTKEEAKARKIRRGRRKGEGRTKIVQGVVGCPRWGKTGGKSDVYRNSDTCHLLRPFFLSPAGLRVGSPDQYRGQVAR